jgi:hypothetical protein
MDNVRGCQSLLGMCEAECRNHSSVEPDYCNCISGCLGNCTGPAQSYMKCEANGCASACPVFGGPDGGTDGGGMSGAVCSDPPSLWNLTFTITGSGGTSCPTTITQMVTTQIWWDTNAYPGKAQSAVPHQYVSWNFSGQGACNIPNQGFSPGYGGEVSGSGGCTIGFTGTLYYSLTNQDPCTQTLKCGVNGTGQCSLLFGGVTVTINGNMLSGNATIASGGSGPCTKDGAAITITGTRQ